MSDRPRFTKQDTEALVARLEATLQRPDLDEGEREEMHMHLRNARTSLRRRLLDERTPTHRPN